MRHERQDELIDGSERRGRLAPMTAAQTLSEEMGAMPSALTEAARETQQGNELNDGLAADMGVTMFGSPFRDISVTL